MDNNNNTNKALVSIKRFKSAYMYFCMENRAKFIQNNPDMKSIDITKLLGKEWKNLVNKEPYYLLEKRDKEIFNKSKSKNKFSYKKSNKVKKPKRFRTAFMLYLKEKKEELKGNGEIIDSLKEIGRKWKLMEIKDKQEYLNKEKEDKKRYKNEYLEYIDKVIKQKETKENKKEKIAKLFQDIPKIFKSNTDIVDKISIGFQAELFNNQKENIKECEDKDYNHNEIIQSIKTIFSDDNNVITLLQNKSKRK